MKHVPKLDLTYLNKDERHNHNKEEKESKVIPLILFQIRGRALRDIEKKTMALGGYALKIYHQIWTLTLSQSHIFQSSLSSLL